MLLGRILGYIVFLIGLPILATDFLVWADTGIWNPMEIGSLWDYLDPRSLIIARFVVEDYVGQIIWNPFVVGILAWWAFLAAMAFGLGLTLLCRRRRGSQRRYSARRGNGTDRSYRPLYLVNFDER